jgi:hypothetical protein
MSQNQPNLKRITMLALGMAGTLGMTVTAVATAAEPAAAPAQWHKQALKFDYSGFTTFYSCDGLEGKVRDILLTFGARKDAKVRATGCSEGPNRPSRFAWVSAEFSSLAPAADPAAADVVKAGWARVQLAPNRPSYMGAGECELVERMRDLLQKGFALRNTEYRAACTPHQVSVADYSVTTEVLKPIVAN